MLFSAPYFRIVKTSRKFPCNNFVNSRTTLNVLRDVTIWSTTEVSSLNLRGRLKVISLRARGGDTALRRVLHCHAYTYTLQKYITLRRGDKP